MRIETGGVFLLSAQRSFVLASDSAAVPIEAASVFSPNVSEVVNLGGEECHQNRRLRSAGPCTWKPTRRCPASVDPRAGRFAAWPSCVRSSTNWATSGRRNYRGAGLASAQIAQLIFIQILRAHLEAIRRPCGWMATRDAGRWNTLAGQPTGDFRNGPDLGAIYRPGGWLQAQRRCMLPRLWYESHLLDIGNATRAAVAPAQAR